MKLAVTTFTPPPLLPLLLQRARRLSRSSGPGSGMLLLFLSFATAFAVCGLALFVLPTLYPVIELAPPLLLVLLVLVLALAEARSRRAA